MKVVGLMDHAYLRETEKCEVHNRYPAQNSEAVSSFVLGRGTATCFSSEAPGALGPKKRGWCTFSLRYLVPKGLLVILLPSP